MQRHLYKHFQLPGHTGHTVFLLLSLMRLILEHPLSMKITGFIPLRQKYQRDLILKVVTELLSYIVIEQRFLFLDLVACCKTTFGFSGLLIHVFYLIIRDSTCTFLASEMELFAAVVNDVKVVTIARWHSYFLLSLLTVVSNMLYY